MNTKARIKQLKSAQQTKLEISQRIQSTVMWQLGCLTNQFLSERQREISTVLACDDYAIVSSKCLALNSKWEEFQMALEDIPLRIADTFQVDLSTTDSIRSKDIGHIPTGQELTDACALSLIIESHSERRLEAERYAPDVIPGVQPIDAVFSRGFTNNNVPIASPVSSSSK